MTMVDYRTSGNYMPPQRKPLPPHPSLHHDLQPLTKIVPDEPTPIQTTQRRSSIPYSAYPPRQASRQTTSTSPSNPPFGMARRTPSQSTTSTSHTGAVPSRTPSNVSSHISRTSSTRSGASVTPGSYVALMRKQKATVWCDRAQSEDPRMTQQQKAAKVRAAREVNTSLLSVEGRTSTSGSMGSGSMGVRSKIRHHGLPKTTGFNANLAGGGVPMRLSANEVGDEGTYNREAESAKDWRHERTASQGSAGSRSRYLGIREGPPRRYSSGSVAHSATRSSPGNEDIPELEETPVPGSTQGGDYFSAVSSSQPGSGSSSDREASFGNATALDAPPAARPDGKTEEELRRRGSVDERANTMGYMGGGRLFVANPDLSD